jgi:hypothetical protein
MHKLYFFAEEVDTGAIFLVEVAVTIETRRLSAVFKTQSKEMAPQFTALFKALLEPYSE